MYDRHNKQGRDGNYRMVAEHIITCRKPRKFRGVCKFCRDSDIIGAERCRHNSRGGCDNTRCGQRAHACLDHNRIQCGKQDDGKVRCAWHNERQKVSNQEYNRDKDIYGLDFPNRFCQHADSYIVCLNRAHVGRVPAKDQDDKARRADC